ncbi:unnamed protein product [Notodromas monacha]|uniref:Uncharacterized protein n=1 Tax=Notodromas monacha TaxID=399045 RepID=A0A7R9GBU4_9CRUS|nr:unnamed protein product [Notodromas monacha]CAG0915161.1 unnamed protein product [Notodromas monacha]
MRKLLLLLCIVMNGRATLEEQQRLAAELFNFVGNNSSTGHKERRAIYRKHYYFIDFWKHGFKMPIYFNTVRDPVAREFSKFYFVRAKHVLEYINDTFKIDIEMETWKRNSKKALGKALENIEKFYPVVGVLEKWNETLTVMEEFPKTRPFFKGITDIYYSKARKEGKEGRINYNDSNKPKQGITPKVKEALGEMLSSEYTLYKFLMKRLMNQYAVVTLLKNISSSHDASSRGEAYVFDDE